MAEPINIPPIASRRVEIDPMGMRSARPPMQSQSPGLSFQKVLDETIGEVQRLQTEADSTIQRLVSGDIKDVTEAMVAVEKADVAFQTMMQVRNRIVAAYEEIMRMQV
jgi:flagellar hook-basal body complex protein FliE